jgi:hypothetical protein
MFWGPGLTFMLWFFYRIWAAGGFHSPDKMLEERRRLDHLLFSPIPLTLWFVWISLIVLFIFSQSGKPIPKREKTFVLLAIGGGLVALILRFLGVTSAP